MSAKLYKQKEPRRKNKMGAKKDANESLIEDEDNNKTIINKDGEKDQTEEGNGGAIKSSLMILIYLRWIWIQN